MSKVKELYVSLRDDPDLPVPEGESRESAAWNEASQRTRQHNTNAKALAMANESSLEKFADFIEKASLSKRFVEDALEVIVAQKWTRKERKKFINGLTDTKLDNFGNNIDKYFYSERDDAAEGLQEDLAGWVFSLSSEDRDKLFKHLSDNKHPFTVDANVDRQMAKDKGYIASNARSTKGKYPLSIEGAAHLLATGLKLGTSSQNPYHISAAKFESSSVDLTNDDNLVTPEPIVAEVEETQKQLNNTIDKTADKLAKRDYFSSKLSAKKFINAQNPTNRKEVTDLFDIDDKDEATGTIPDWSDALGGGKIPATGNLEQGYIDHFKTGKDAWGNDSDFINEHKKRTGTVEEKPPPAPFSATVHNVKLDADDVIKKKDGTYRINPEAGEFLFDYSETIGETTTQRKPWENKEQKKYLQNLVITDKAKISGALKDVVPPTINQKELDTLIEAQEKKTQRETNKRIAEQNAIKDLQSAAKKQGLTISTKRAQALIREHKNPKDALKAHQDNEAKVKAEADAKVKADAAAKAKKKADQEEKSFKDRLVAHAKEQSKILHDAYRNPKPEGRELSDNEIKALTHHQDVIRPAIISGDDDRILAAMEEHFDGHGGVAHPIASEHKDAKELLGKLMRGETKPTPPESKDTPKDTPKKAPTDDDSELSRKERITDLIEHNIEAFKAEYEKKFGLIEEHKGKDDHTFEEYKAKLIEDNSKSADSVEAFKITAHVKRIAAKKEAQKAAEAAEVKAKKAADNKVKTEVTNLQTKAEEKGIKLTATKAKALIGEHGDADKALEAHEKSLKLQEEGDIPEKEAQDVIDEFDGDTDAALKAYKDANTLPDHISSMDKITEQLYGEKGVSRWLGHGDERHANRFGATSTALARDLLAHYKYYDNKGTLSKETEDKIFKQIYLLQNPDKIQGRDAPEMGTGANIDEAEKQADKIISSGHAPNSPEANRIFRTHDDVKDQQSRNFHDKYIDRDEKVKWSAEEKDHQKEAHKVFSEHKGDATKWGVFDKNGKMIGRQKYNHDNQDYDIESLADDGSDDHIKNGEVDAKGSRVKEHHHLNLNENQQSLMNDLHTAHDKWEGAIKSGDETALQNAKDEFNAITGKLEESGIHKEAFLHEENERPETGPPDPEVARRKIANGYIWHEETRAWGLKKNLDDWRKDNGAGGAQVGTASAFGFHTSTHDPSTGTLTDTPLDGHMLISQHGVHRVNLSPSSPGSTNKELQAQRLGQSQAIRSALEPTKPAITGRKGILPKVENVKKPPINNVSHNALQNTGLHTSASENPKGSVTPPSVDDVTTNVRQTATTAANKAKKIIGNLFGKADIDELTANEILQLHLYVQKTKEKDKIGV